jgi:hypothetical protein
MKCQKRYSVLLSAKRFKSQGIFCHSFPISCADRHTVFWKKMTWKRCSQHHGHTKSENKPVCYKSLIFGIHFTEAMLAKRFDQRSSGTSLSYLQCCCFLFNIMVEMWSVISSLVDSLVLKEQWHFKGFTKISCQKTETITESSIFLHIFTDSSIPYGASQSEHLDDNLVFLSYTWFPNE